MTPQPKLNLGDRVRVRPGSEYYCAEGHDQLLTVIELRLDVGGGITVTTANRARSQRWDEEIDGWSESDLELVRTEP